MKKLNEFVKKEEWSKAQEYVKTLDQPKNIEFFNLAYLEFKSGNFVQAKYLLEKAKYSGLFSKETEGALALVREKLEIREIEESISPYDFGHLTFLSLPSAVSPSLIIFCLLCGIFSVYKKFLIGFLISMLAAGLLIFNHYDQEKYSLYINLEDQGVHLGPSKIFEQLQILPSGLKYSISKEVKDWRYIHSPKEYQGWIYKTKAIKYELP